MGAISLSRSDLKAGAAFVVKTLKAADVNDTGVVYPDEINSYRGVGKASMKKIFAWGRHLEGGSEGTDFVRISKIKSNLPKLISALMKIADEKGNEDGRLNGGKAELGVASTAGAALARLSHALKA
jgi:hypothetical protein